IVAVRSPPSTATPASAAARQRGVAGPPNAIAIVADRYPPTTSAIVIKNGTIPGGSLVGSGGTGTISIFGGKTVPAALRAVRSADAALRPAAGTTNSFDP